MSRAVADATRFTATSPHALSKAATSRLAASRAATAAASAAKPSPKPLKHVPPASPQIRRPLPSSKDTKPSDGSTETPAQKVARLRAEYAAKRLAEISMWDRIVVRGREIADSAHRFTVMFIVLFSIVAAGVTVFSLQDMIRYNRRKKREWYADQHKKYKEALAIAIAAEADGTANEAQLLLLKREREAEAEEEEKRKKKGLWKKFKSLFSFFSSESLKKEETPFGMEAPDNKPADDEAPVPVPPPQAPGVKDSLNNSTSKSPILSAIEEKRRAGERLLESQKVEPGPLDKLAEGAAEATNSSSGQKGWGSWFGR